MKASFLMVLHCNVKRRNAKTHEALHYLVGYVVCISYSMVTLEILHFIHDKIYHAVKLTVLH